MSILTCPVISTEDEADFRSVLRHVYSRGNGADIIFILGTTGGFYVLSICDKRRLVDIAVDEVGKLKEESNKHLELAVGVTGNDFDETVKLAQYAEEKGADYAVLMPLYIDSDATTTAVGVVDKTTTIRWILYNHPLITNRRNIKPYEWESLSLHERIQKLKDSSGDPGRADSYRKGYGELHIGDEILGLEIPCDGIVAGSSNVLSAVWARAARRDNEDIPSKLTRFQKVYAENPVGSFHYMLCKLGVISSNEPVDSGLKVDSELKKDLDELMDRDDFKELYALNFGE
jgi:dihydrodipicolinate synthase/N-acetylneuraminate lyase